MNCHKKEEIAPERDRDRFVAQENILDLPYKKRTGQVLAATVINVKGEKSLQAGE